MIAWSLFVGVLLATFSVAGPVPQSPLAGSAQKLEITVSDENGVSVAAAHVFLQASRQNISLRCETDFAGHCEFDNLRPQEVYQLRVEKEGFYASVLRSVQVDVSASVEVTLSHQREVREVVNVVESPPAIDPEQTSSEEQLSGLDILNIPYPTTRDYRNALRFIPGVVQDNAGQPHIDGAETYQTLTLLDGFNITQPANGLLVARVSTDALRSVDVERSRYSAEYGKGSGGVLSLNTGIGEDHFRFSATNFIPSLQGKKGLRLDKVDPRFTVSGPFRKGKMWFFDAIDGEYDNIVVTELPSGSDQDRVWRIGNLAKLQMNFTRRNILTTSFLINRFHDPHAGLSPFNPQPATPVDAESAEVATVKDQYYFRGGELLETGFGFVQYGMTQTPVGDSPYFISTNTTGGSYYLSSHTIARRWQGLMNLYLPVQQWFGRHEVKLGIDLDRPLYRSFFLRQPISVLREAQSLPANGNCLTVSPAPCSRYSVFPGGGNSATYNLEASGFIQDRWLMTNRLLLEPSLRFDWDEILRRTLLSPRLAATYVLNNQATTKFSAGIGILYDATSLFLIARPSEGERLDYFFDANGQLSGPPLLTTFVMDKKLLTAPRVVNWSIGLEKKLPASVYLRTEFLQKRGEDGFVYNIASGAPAGTYFLQNTRKDRYDAVQVDLRKHFRENYTVMASYIRSRTRSNQVVDFSVDNPFFGPQVAGLYPWDAPNRFLSWGLLPLKKGLDMAYSTELRSGFPFSVLNTLQPGQPGDLRRFPTYFALNLHLEKRFHLFGFSWAIRAGFNDITDHKNPAFVNGDVNSPRFSDFERRAFTTRIRFLGRI